MLRPARWIAGIRFLFGVPVSAVQRKGRPADRDIFSPGVIWRAVPDPLAPVRNHCLASLNVDAAPRMFHPQQSLKERKRQGKRIYERSRSGVEVG